MVLFLFDIFERKQSIIITLNYVIEVASRFGPTIDIGEVQILFK